MFKNEFEKTSIKKRPKKQSKLTYQIYDPGHKTKITQ